MKKSKYCCHPPFHPPIFLSPFFKTFVTHPPKINELDTVVTPTLILRPLQPPKIWNVQKHFYGLVDKLNNTETEMIGMKPKDAIKLNEVPLVTRESYPPEDKLPEDGLHRYLLQPGEEHDDQ